MSMPMRLFPTLLAATLGSALAAAPVQAERPRDQDRAFRAMQDGRAMPLPQIVRRVRPMMGGDEPFGVEMHGESYRLKFYRDNRVIWVDVDPATGRVISKTGN